MEANVGPLCRGPDWMPITPKRGSFLHADFTTKAGPGAEGPLFLPPDVHAEGEWVRLWANFDHAQIFCPSRSGSKSDMLDRELRAEFGVIERRSGARRPDVDSMSGLTTS